MCALVLLSLGGWLFHIRFHPFTEAAENLIPFLAGFLSIAAIPLLFWWRRTIQWAYLLNGMTVIYGTITMGHFSLSNLPEKVTLVSLFMNTLFPDIAVLWTKFALGKALFDLNLLHSEKDELSKMKWYRYPAMGWWLVHLFAMTTVYTLGNLLWR